ncbi:MAG: hypothetical protein ACLR06_11845 [Christensenellaceae bacterium]
MQSEGRYDIIGAIKNDYIIRDRGEKIEGKFAAEKRKKYSVGDIVSFSVIVLLCAAMAVLDFVKIRYTSDAVNNELISDTVPLAVGSIAVIWLMIRGKTRLFRPSRPSFVSPSRLACRREQFSLSFAFYGQNGATSYRRG